MSYALKAITPAALRMAEMRARRKEAGLQEVRGIWASPTLHPAIRKYAEKLEGKKK